MNQKPRTRFSLRALFALQLVVAVFLALGVFVLRHVQEAQRLRATQKAAIRQLVNLDVAVGRYDKDDDFDIEVCLNEKELSGEVVALLGTLADRIVTLDVSGCVISDQAMTDIAKLARLRQLRMKRVTLDWSVLSKLANLPELRVLDLEWNRIGDNEVALLRDCSSLAYLNLFSTDTTDRSLLQFEQMPKLRSVDCGFTWVTADAAEEVRRRGSHFHISSAGTPPNRPRPPD